MRVGSHTRNDQKWEGLAVENPNLRAGHISRLGSRDDLTCQICTTAATSLSSAEIALATGYLWVFTKDKPFAMLAS